MRLTIYTDYSLRLLMYLALKENDLATIAEVAQSYDISKNHLMKVAHQLGVAGYIETIRGRSGGLRLARSPKTINLGDVVRHTEPDMALVPCFKPIDAFCVIQPSCVLRDVLQRAQTAFIDVLDDYSLNDLVQSRTRLRDLLSIKAVSRLPTRSGARRPQKAAARA
ncbi:MAG: Rrf2 family transcriptional regulator [Ktedonobacteraceae bacterium]